jgi:hypothetical protein
MSCIQDKLGKLAADLRGGPWAGALLLMAVLSFDVEVVDGAIRLMRKNHKVRSKWGYGRC